MANALETAKEIFPQFDDQYLEHLIWSHTGYPCFWPNKNISAEENFRNQLLEVKAKIDAHIDIDDELEKMLDNISLEYRKEKETEKKFEKLANDGYAEKI